MKQSATSSPDAVTAADERRIIAAVDAVGFFADRGQWDRVAAQFHPEGVTLDYRSHASASAGMADEPVPQSPRSVIEAWQAVLPGYEHTQHVMSNHQVTVEGDGATVVSTVHATHVLGGEHWVFLGDYEYRLVRTDEGWRIVRMTANMRAELGDPDLPRRAAERVAKGKGRPVAEHV